MRLGRRCVRYPMTALREWVEQQVLEQQLRAARGKTTAHLIAGA